MAIQISDINRVRLHFITPPKELLDEGFSGDHIDGHLTFLDAYRGVELTFVDTNPYAVDEFKLRHIFFHWGNIISISTLPARRARANKNHAETHPWQIG
jgi:hypothetical protein